MQGTTKSNITTQLL